MLADWFTTCGYPALWNRLQKFPAPSSFFPRSEVDRRLDLYRYLESIINFKVERALLDSSILCRRVCGARSFAPSFFRRQCGRRVVNLCTCGNLTLILSSRFFLLLLFFFCFSIEQESSRIDSRKGGVNWSLRQKVYIVGWEFLYGTWEETNRSPGLMRETIERYFLRASMRVKYACITTRCLGCEKKSAILLYTRFFLYSLIGHRYTRSWFSIIVCVNIYRFVYGNSN